MTMDVKFDDLLPGARLGSVDGLNIDIDEGTEQGFSDGTVLDTTLGASKGPTLGTNDGTYLVSLEGFNDVTAFFLKEILVLVYGIKL